MFWTFEPVIDLDSAENTLTALNAALEADAMPSGKLFRDLDSALFGAAALGQPAMTVGFDTEFPPLGRGSFKPKLRE